MLIEFSVGNFLSIKDRQTLRMDASSISEHKDQLIDAGRYKLLRSAVIYGANASGKSNILKAIDIMQGIVTTSAAQSSNAELPIEPFLLSTETETAPSYFEVLFLIDGTRYRYGFEADTKKVQTEWFFESRKKQEKYLFLRNNDGIDVSEDFKEGKGLEDKTRDNALFLAICDQFNGKVARRVLEQFNSFLFVSGIEHHKFRKHLFRLLDISSIREHIMKIIRDLSLGISDIQVQKGDIDDAYLSNYAPEYQQFLFDSLNGKRTTDVMVVHKKYSESNEPVSDVFFNLKASESAGTNKFFDLLAPLYLALDRGGLLIVDELDVKLHPLMTQAIIRFFNDPTLNPNNAQLIFTTHDTNLLTYGGFRRDQIYFTEKDQYGATCLYSLVEYQEENGDKVRKDRSYEKDYIQGRYGAIPFIGDLSKLAPAWHEK